MSGVSVIVGTVAVAALAASTSAVRTRPPRMSATAAALENIRLIFT